MELNQAKKLTLIFMEIYGLKKWHFEWINSKNAFGRCDTLRQIIKLSKDFVKINKEIEIRDTILHEIAHALCPKHEHHGKEWKAKAEELGCNPSRHFNTKNITVPLKRYTAYCENCGKESQKDRIGNIACGKCCKKFNKGEYDVKFKIKYKWNRKGGENV